MFLSAYLVSGCDPVKSLTQDILAALTTLRGQENRTIMPIKQVLFDFGSLLGSKISIEGTIKEISIGKTYLVIQDNSGFITVPTVNIVLPPPYLKEGSIVQVSGTVKYGHNQIPVLEAEKFYSKG